MADAPKKPNFNEIGIVGHSVDAMGIVREAYITELDWPGSYETVFKRLHQSDPEASIVRQVYEVLARKAKLSVDMPTDPNEDDEKARDFVLSALDEVEGGIEAWQVDAASKAPFYGWGVWEINYGLRKEGWKKDGWESEHDDEYIGLRSLTWRDYSSFYGWERTPDGRRLAAYKQIPWNDAVAAGGIRAIPYDKLVHLRHGDITNPFGMSVYIPLYRLERVKYGFELVLGVGSERSAGYLSVDLEKTPSPEDEAAIRQMARSVMSVQEGNHLVSPPGVTASIIDTPFAAAETLLASIRFWHLVKLQVLFAAQWVAISTTAETGTYAAATDSSQMFIDLFNATFKSIISQFDRQVVARLWKMNKHNFPNATKRPRLVAEEVTKAATKQELAQLVIMLSQFMPFGEKDFLALRRASGVLPIEIPEDPIHIPNSDKQVDLPDQSQGPGRPEKQEKTTVVDGDEGEGGSDEEEEADMMTSDASVAALRWAKKHGVI